MKGPYSPEVPDDEWHRVDRAIKAMRESGGDIRISFGSRERCWRALAFQGTKSGKFGFSSSLTKAVREAVWTLVEFGDMDWEQQKHFWPEIWKPAPASVVFKLKEIGLDEPSDWEQFQINLEGTHL